MNLKVLTLLVIVHGVLVQSEQLTPTIQLEEGSLQGVIKPDALRGYYYSYTDIPYATVEKRFQVATPVTKWEGILEAKTDQVRCSQVNFPPFSVIQVSTDVVNQEDCLTLNVYTPEPKPADALKPVMVFFFGGAFLVGSASPQIYGPEYLLRNDVILVSINYRVDIFGFLCLGIDEAPGNVGFKDQVEALKWVKRNIKAFGGDPDNVTIFGQSAGAASVMYHVVSPMSQGLFHKVIAQSSSSLSPFSTEYEPLTVATKIASLMGYSTQDPKELYNIFMNKTADELLSFRAPRSPGDIGTSEIIYGACVEKELEGVEPFLTDLPYNLFASGQYAKVPMILGYTAHEGYAFVTLETPGVLENITFYNSVPKDLAFPTEQEKKDTAAKLEELYMEGKAISSDSILNLVAYEGETQLAYSMAATADIISRTSDKPVYMYNFDYSGLLNLFKYGTSLGFAPGATHCDELFYLFKHSLAGPAELIESTMIQRMTSLWTNFAKNGEPVPVETPLLPLKWDPFTVDSQNMLIINTTFSMAPMWNSEKFLFLNQTYSQYRRLTVSSD